MARKAHVTTWSENEYTDLLYRFNQVFPVRKGNERIFIPGNHDLGFNVPNGEKLVAMYTSTFGPPFFFKKVHGLEIVGIASTALYPTGTPTPQLYTELWEFLESFKDKEASKTRILLTHIPLYRPPSTSCGNGNPNYHLLQSHGYSYFTMVNSNETQRILDLVKPNFIFSGDAHEDCHVIRPDGSQEWTVNTFGWMQGSLEPGCAIITIRSKSSNDNKPDRPSNAEGNLQVDVLSSENSEITVTQCQFHNQLLVYFIYLFFLFFSVAFFFLLVIYKSKIFVERVKFFIIFISVTGVLVLPWYCFLLVYFYLIS
eukprot:TRINITY_DN2840_c0_g4_i2.p1 TRINITY_DN2840_c0_g4~~TRINITY_DN2840_c0_g4_i2.p1  ORF type:complete len:313 (+),score=42.62 TRINITY_DN2840_c0_g4_i2:372-1310(+)